MIKNFKWLVLVSLTFVACNNNDEEVVVYNTSDGLPPTAGTANFSKFVSLGNSLTSGYADSALFIDGQKASYVNILAQQFATVGGGDFKIPFMADNIGGYKINGIIYSGPRFYWNGSAPVPVSGTPSTEILTSIAAAGPYNNCGVPGAKSFHLLSPGYGSLAGISLGTANPYYVRFAPNATTSVLAYAMSQTPTFFSLWIGNNDVLGYAASGGDGSDPITPSAGAAGVGFDATYDALINTLTSAGAKGVIANIPYVNSTPFFTTVPYNPLTSSVLGGGSVPVGEATIDALNAQLYGPLKQALTAFGAGNRINLLSKLVANPNPLLISDEKLTNLSAQLTAAFTPTLGAANAAAYGQVFGQARQATKDDLVLLTTRGIIAGNTGYPAPLDKFGITFPLLDKHVLIATEIAEVKAATDAYNAKILSVATAKGLAFVDANAALNQVATGGFTADGFTVTSAYITGGGFSTDGFHLSPRGYALVANKFIEAINKTYSSNLKGVSLADYRILFPKTL